MCYPSRNVEDFHAEYNWNCGDIAQEVSVEKILVCGLETVFSCFVYDSWAAWPFVLLIFLMVNLKSLFLATNLKLNKVVDS